MQIQKNKMLFFRGTLKSLYYSLQHTVQFIQTVIQEYVLINSTFKYYYNK